MDNYLTSLENQIKEINNKIDELTNMKDDADTDMTELIEGELSDLIKQKSALEDSINAINSISSQSEELDNQNYTGDLILEIRAGTGGNEAGLFANELLNMYMKYAESNKWDFTLISKNDGGLGNIKEVVAEITSSNPKSLPYSKLQYESGVHRVQRVPITESSGRIHTSAATVSILPIVKDAEIEVNETDLKIDTYKASGAGGQHVNKTESAIRITHMPTGVVVQCQDERSQHKNRDRAMSILKTKLYDLMQQQQKDSIDDLRSDQVGTGDRSEKIKTYNFPQDRMTDHRIKKSWFGLDKIMAGEIDEILSATNTSIQENE